MFDGMTWFVRRFHWRKFLIGPEPRYVRLPGSITVAEFDDREDAEADRWQRELAVRKGVNPFRCGFDLADLTHLPTYAFKDYLMDDSIRPAKYDSYAQVRWDKWWGKHSPDWSDDRKARIWEALDKVRFFEVVGRPVSRQLFVAVEAVSNFRPRPFWDRWRFPSRENDVGTEGGRPVRAFRSQADADAYLELVAETASVPSRTQIDTDPFTHPDDPVELPADRVYDVSLGGEVSPSQPTVFVVCRVGLATMSRHDPGFPGWEFDQYTTGEVRWAEPRSDFDAFPTEYAVRHPRLVPEAVFTDRETAEADVLVRERAARRWLNPHLIYDFTRTSHDNLERIAQEWSAKFANAPDEEHGQAWAAFSHNALYRVVEIELEN